MKRLPLYIGLLMLLMGTCDKFALSQAYGYEFINKKKKKIKIKFKRYNNLIIVPVILNDTFPLNFILDTGVRHTLLTKRIYTDSLKIKYGRKFVLYGADKASHLVAFIAPNLQLRLPGLLGKRKALLVLENDYFELDNSIGIPIHGILGTDIFLRYTIKIDYNRQLLTLYEPDYFRPPSSYNDFSIDLYNDKPYLDASIILENGVAVFDSYLLDTGASLSVLLDLGLDKRITLPRRYIRGRFGQILGGELNSFVGRTQFLGFGRFTFKEVVTNFQKPILQVDSSAIYGIGLVGGGILRRFNVIFDFLRKKIYLRPNRFYSSPFIHDRSGLLIKVNDKTTNLEISDVVELSPAGAAGLKVGDIIVRCNGRKKRKLKLEYINAILQGEVNNLVRLIILRNGKLIKVKFRLKDLI